MNERQCMGGWCRRRESCAHYSAPPTPGLNAAERLCEPGRDEPLRNERAKLAADPRFAQWAAGQPVEAE